MHFWWRAAPARTSNRANRGGRICGLRPAPKQDQTIRFDVYRRIPGTEGKVKPISHPYVATAHFLARQVAPIVSADGRLKPCNSVTVLGGPKPMIRSELIQKISDDNPHLYQRDVEKIVNTIFDEITRAMAEGDRVELRGFGAFSVKKRDGRTGRNPRTGEAVDVDEKHVPFFKTGKLLRDRLNAR